MNQQNKLHLHFARGPGQHAAIDYQTDTPFFFSEALKLQRDKNLLNVVPIFFAKAGAEKQ
jgi:hypothetical protein